MINVNHYANATYVHGLKLHDLNELVTFISLGIQLLK
jgi:hypothetical protein